VFLDDAFAGRCARAASEIVAQLADPARRAALERAIPERFAGGDDALPQFAVVDFAVVRDADGSFVPRLVELQGFPSLAAFEVLQSDAWLATLAGIEGFGRDLTPWFGGLDRAAFLALARRTIVGDADPAETVLLDLEPRAQKTYCDFAATERLFGIESCDPRDLYVRDRRTYRRDASGRERRVTRVYNRIVGDDLLRDDVALAFDVRDDIGVTWAAHPRWFWAWSKASLPHLAHEAVPETTLVSELERVPPDLERYVLKPLFSFAGAGVNLHPTRADIERIPAHERAGWCVQEKIVYDPALEAADGGWVKLEIRVMLLRPDDEAELVPATNLCRLSRGEMIGVDYNRDRTWVGSSVALW